MKTGGRPGPPCLRSTAVHTESWAGTGRGAGTAVYTGTQDDWEGSGAGHSPVLAAFGQGSGGDFDVQVPPLQRPPPGAGLALRPARLKVQEAYPSRGRLRLLQNQQASVL